MKNNGLVFSGVTKLDYENICCDILGNKFLNIKIMTLPIQNDELLQEIIDYIKSGEDFKITIEKLEEGK